jgi:hypothetical protein
MLRLFAESDQCNRAILAALEAGALPIALGDLFRRKEALLGQLGAITPLSGPSVAAQADWRETLDQIAQAQAQAIRSEAKLSAALQPHIPYHGNRMNPYQQPSNDLAKNALEREG